MREKKSPARECRAVTDGETLETFPKSKSEISTQALRVELHDSDVAEAFGYRVTSSSPVLSLCRDLLDDGCGEHEPLECWRGDMRCLSIRSIGEAARLHIGGDGIGFRPIPEPVRGSPIDQIAPAATTPLAPEPPSAPAPDSPPSSRRAA